jgi:hypothetical protein
MARSDEIDVTRERQDDEVQPIAGGKQPPERNQSFPSPTVFARLSGGCLPPAIEQEPRSDRGTPSDA